MGVRGGQGVGGKEGERLLCCCSAQFLTFGPLQETSGQKKLNLPARTMLSWLEQTPDN